MTITALTDLTKLPNQSQDQATFDANMAFFIGNLPERARQENELAEGMNAVAIGGAYAFMYAFDSSTANTDPGPGKFRLSSGTQSSSTALRIDNVLASGQDLTAVWADLLAVTSAVKGSLRLVSATDPTKWMILDVNGSVAVTGYRNLNVSVRASSATTPFANNDPVMVYLQRGGDKGDVSSTAFPTLRVQDRKAAGAGGGSAVSGVNARVLNTVLTNTISGASLASGRVTLPAGAYKVTGSAPAYAVAAHQAYLSDFSGGSILVLGTVEISSNSSPFGQSRSLVVGEITLAATTTLVLNTWVASSQADVGLGTNYNTGQLAVFSELLFEKVG